MRALIVVHAFPPWAAGGTEHYTRDFAMTLASRHGDDVTVLTRESDAERPERSVREERRDGLRVIVVNSTFRDSRGFRDSYRDSRLRGIVADVLEDASPEICHVQHLTGLTIDLVEELRRRGIPSVLTLNDYWILCQRGQLLDLEYRRCPGPSVRGCARCLSTGWWNAYDRRARMRRLTTKVDVLLAPSETLRQQFVRFGVPEDRLSVVRQGIDQDPRVQRGTAPMGRPVRLGFMGSMMVSKGPDVLMEAFAGLPRGVATLQLFGAYTPYHGDDRYRERLAALVAHPGIEWRGPVEHAEVAGRLAALDVLVVPSIWIENAPFVIKEAFAVGVPVVAAKLGGMAELVEHERSGLLFAPGDAGSLRSALERLCVEEGLWERLRAGIPRVKTMADDVDETRALYVQLAGDARR